MWTFVVTSALLVHHLAQAAAIDDCLKAASVPVDVKDSNDWKQDVAPFNTRLKYTPVAIVVPSTVQHVQAAVSCAAKVGLKINAKSGGHSYASFGLGGENGHVIVELDRLNKVTLDTKTNTASVQAGSRLGHLYSELYKQGNRAISHGTCSGVGLAGHSLHGGFGFSSHTHGLALDWITGMTVVLANSTVVNVTETQNPDLFWAMRGAGSSYGIVTNFYLKTFAAPSQVTSFQVALPWTTVDSLVAGWTVVQDYTRDTMPREMNMRIFSSFSGTQIQGLYHGTAADLQTSIAPLVQKLNSSLSAVQQTDWMGGFVAYANGEAIDLGHPYNHQEYFFSKSLATTELPAATMRAVANYWLTKMKQTTRMWFIIIDMYGGKNSAITEVPKGTSSYAYRDDTLFLYEFYDRDFSNNYPANGFDLLNGLVNSFTSNLKESQWGMYINYADPTMNRTYAQNVYWRNSLSRLQKIKAAVDPKDLFYYPQGVEPRA